MIALKRQHEQIEGELGGGTHPRAVNCAGPERREQSCNADMLGTLFIQ